MSIFDNVVVSLLILSQLFLHLHRIKSIKGPTNNRNRNTTSLVFSYHPEIGINADGRIRWDMPEADVPLYREAVVLIAAGLAFSSVCSHCLYMHCEYNYFFKCPSKFCSEELILLVFRGNVNIVYVWVCAVLTTLAFHKLLLCINMYVFVNK